MYTPVKLSKMKSGIYRIRFTINGKDVRNSLKTKDRKLAEQRRYEMEKSVNSSGYSDEQIVNIFFKDVIDEFLQEEKTYKKESTWKNYIYRLPYIKKSLGSYLIRSLKMDHYKQFLLDLHNITNHNIKNSTRNRWHDHLSALCSFAVKKGYLDKNPMKAVPKYKQNIESSGIRHLTEDECVKLIESTPETKPIWATYIYTGMRQGELIGLMWDDIDFDNKIIRVRRNRNVSTKSNKERIVGMHKDLELILQEHKSNSNSKYVFPASNGKMRKSNFRHLFDSALKNAEITGKVTEHNLRHTCASLLSKAGVSAVEIQRLLGHSDIKTTLRYIHYSDKDLVKAVNRVQLERNR